MTYDIRTTCVTVAPEREPLFSEMATKVQIVDEAAGEYVEVCQSGREDLGKIAISSEEWPALRDAIDMMIKDCREVAK